MGTCLHGDFLVVLEKDLHRARFFEELDKEEVVKFGVEGGVVGDIVLGSNDMAGANEEAFFID